MLSDTISKVSSDCTEITTWAVANGLILDLAKIRVIILGSPRNLDLIDIQALSAVTIDGTPVTYVSKVKNLGAWSSSNLR